jgi:polar amino acid transport system substrate-binding protein
MFRRLTATALAVAVVSLVACGSEDKDSTAQGGDSCATITPDVLTIGTGSPAYSPWVENDAPESGEGFEAAVALAVAAELGYEGDAVKWVRTTFDEAIAPGAKNFDFNLQQYSITDERSETISFSEPYYSSNQAIVALTSANVPEGAITAELLAGIKFGVQAGTTSLDFVNEVIKPSNEVFVYDDNAGAKAALEAGQIDAIVVDLPTALYISYVEIEGTSVIGQFPAAAGGTSDDFGLVFEKDSDLVACVNTALAAIKASGALATIEQTWLSDNTGVPVITLD